MIENRSKRQETRFLLMFLLIGFLGFSQTKGIVKDSITGQPIPYVSVWVENENIGTTAEENGEFVINTNDQHKNLVFSALGYFPKKVSIHAVKNVILKPRLIDLQEVIVKNKKATSEIVIGDYSGIDLSTGVTNTGQENVHIWGKVIESNEKIEQHPFIKSIEFDTRSNLKNAMLRIRFFSLDKEGNSTGENLVEDDIMVTVKKGKSTNAVDLSKYNITIPKEGIIVGFEYLKLKQNIKKYRYTIDGQKRTFEGFRYEPNLLGFHGEINNLRLLNQDGISREFSNVTSVELAVKITLTN